ncbi:hypothetical protein DAPPUDRAFT_334191 [Daphnia pulex]|uniref:Uncharacterized protein n=1 Tax=Daphnia pulex TaxID=6669 RepID=E9HUZ0_DAPPU|nr:hypothetical protein DAPPUDRAFT_334191 [Daphnia pulex]|eukprot:EFX64434.1 hypothetical protein DAPPUDRAFT_334191 [Daphnia pulex]
MSFSENQIHSVLRLFRPFEIKIRPDGHPNRVSVNQDNADLIQLSETRDPHLKQPFICCMGTMETPTNFWIVIDRDIILCGNDFATAFVNLFCSFYAFNLNFPQYLDSFYGFFEECVFDIKIPSPSVTAFRAFCLRDPQS